MAKFIDLRSDTVTLPTEKMRRAMYEAELGDDVYGEDPTVNRLEALAAEKVGKEAALFVTSGTQGNLTCVLAHCQRGDELILGDESHMFLLEVGACAALGGVQMRIIPNNSGHIRPQDVQKAIRGQNIHFPRTGAVAIENTHNRCGGTVLGVEETKAIADVAHACNVPVHLDGARIFNAAVALGIPAPKLTAHVDSLSFCLSKGLSAPVGSLICGTKDFISRARKVRKMLGGGMRQAGVIAAAGVVALNEMVDRLADDHRNAKILAEGLANIRGISLDPKAFPTNIVIFELTANVSQQDFLQRCVAEGVNFNNIGGKQFRVVTHHGVEESHIHQALAAIKRALG